MDLETQELILKVTSEALQLKENYLEIKEAYEKLKAKFDDMVQAAYRDGYKDGMNER